MLISWQTVNAVRRPGSKISAVASSSSPQASPLKTASASLPNDPDSYYASRELVPHDMLDDVSRATNIVITNYHAFKLRERIDISKGGRQLLKGDAPEMISRPWRPKGRCYSASCPIWMGCLKDIFVINDEAYHRYREKAARADEDEEELKGGRQEGGGEESGSTRALDFRFGSGEAEAWVGPGPDLSHALLPRGPGHVGEGNSLSWTMQERLFLMDAIECGIVKLLRVPVAQNLPGAKGRTRCRCSATCGSTSARRCRRRGEAQRKNSIR